MRNDIAGPETESTTAMWEGLEGVVREKAQEFIQHTGPSATLSAQPALREGRQRSVWPAANP